MLSVFTRHVIVLSNEVYLEVDTKSIIDICSLSDVDICNLNVYDYIGKIEDFKLNSKPSYFLTSATTELTHETIDKHENKDYTNVYQKINYNNIGQKITGLQPLTRGAEVNYDTGVVQLVIDQEGTWNKAFVEAIRSIISDTQPSNKADEMFVETLLGNLSKEEEKTKKIMEKEMQSEYDVNSVIIEKSKKIWEKEGSIEGKESYYWNKVATEMCGEEVNGFYEIWLKTKTGPKFVRIRKK